MMNNLEIQGKIPRGTIRVLRLHTSITVNQLKTS